MKLIDTRILVLFMIASGLSACFTNTTIPEQITSLNVDCNAKELQISDEVIELNGEHSWTAKCKGKTYTCSYLAESGMACYELNE